MDISGPGAAIIDAVAAMVSVTLGVRVADRSFVRVEHSGKALMLIRFTSDSDSSMLGVAVEHLR